MPGDTEGVCLPDEGKWCEHVSELYPMTSVEFVCLVSLRDEGGLRQVGWTGAR